MYSIKDCSFRFETNHKFVVSSLQLERLSSNKQSTANHCVAARLKNHQLMHDPCQPQGYEATASVRGSPNLVYINVSPIEYGHVLLVPRVMDCLPQVRPAY